MIGSGLAALALAGWANFERAQADDAPTPKASKKVLLGPATPELTAGIPGTGPLTLDELKVWLDDPKNHEPLEVELPLGLAAGASEIRGLDKNPLTRAKIELGRQIYFDTRISGDNTISCASCHAPDHGFAFGTQFGVGIRGLTGNRNSPPAYNRILSDAQFWDGRAGSLEEQAIGPIANEIEMGGAHDTCVECLAGIPGYKLQFDKIFGGLTIENVGKAIASFERALVTGPSPYDYYERLVPFRDFDLEALQEEDEDAFARYKQLLAESEAHPMSESAKRGRDLFFSDKGGCSACHVGANLTDEKYHNLGVGMDAAEPDLGRYVVTGVEADKGAFKTPTIRNIAQSGPYMHDGSQKTLEEVVEWYAKGGHPNKWLDEKIKKLDLTDQDKADLVAFMQACTGEFPKVERARLPK
jgi:cytochrome c peroxidase